MPHDRLLCHNPFLNVPLDVFPDSELTTIPHPCTKEGTEGHVMCLKVCLGKRTLNSKTVNGCRGQERPRERLEERDDSDYLAVDSSIQSPRQHSVHVFQAERLHHCCANRPKVPFIVAGKTLGKKPSQKGTTSTSKNPARGIKSTRRLLGFFPNPTPPTTVSVTGFPANLKMMDFRDPVVVERDFRAYTSWRRSKA